MARRFSRHHHSAHAPRASATIQITDSHLDPVLDHVVSVYNGSDGEATKAMFAMLEQIGPAGILAVNLLRAQKNSARAKVYRGGNSHGKYSTQAYDLKNWAISNLATALLEHAGAMQIRWGWATDPVQTHHSIVLYIDTPFGQVSFHCQSRGSGPDYPGQWDGQRGTSPIKTCRFVASILAKTNVAALPRPAAPPRKHKPRPVTENEQRDIDNYTAEKIPTGISGPIFVTAGMLPDGTLRVHQFNSPREAAQAGFPWAGQPSGSSAR